MKYTGALSWSKMKLFLACPKQLELTIVRRPVSRKFPNMYMELGNVVQMVFEVYFNQGVNRKAKGTDPRVLDRVCDVVFRSKRFLDRNIWLMKDWTMQRFQQRVREYVQTGRGGLEKAGVLDRPVKSEVLVSATLLGLNVRGKVDFIAEDDQEIVILDGKASREQDANPDQVLLYGAMIDKNQPGKKWVRGGLVYWQHGYVPVDMTPPALLGFLNGDLARTAEVFHKLKTGVDELVATPGKQVCGQCQWKTNCSDSLYYKMSDVDSVAEEVSFVGE